MEEIDVFKSLRESVDGELAPIVDEREAARLKLIADHKAWLKKTKKEHPSPYQFFKVGVYIRYFNQTKYENYLDNHKMQFIDLIQSCPNWTLVDFYVDQGQNAPKMENAPEWCRLLDDCFNNKVDLIITHKVSKHMTVYKMSANKPLMPGISTSNRSAMIFSATDEGDTDTEPVILKIQIDSEIYREAKKVLDSIGISVEEATVLFLKEVVTRKGLPFPVSENELWELRHIRTERDI